MDKTDKNKITWKGIDGGPIWSMAPPNGPTTAQISHP